MHSKRLLVLTLLSFADLMCAQQLAVGVKAGARLQDVFEASGAFLHNESKFYTVGPMIDLRLPFNLGIEFDALYQRYGYTDSAGSVLTQSITREHGNSWEFPILGKFRLLPGPIQPYVEVGYATRVVSGSGVTSLSQQNPLTGMVSLTTTRYDTNYSASHGFVAGAGVDLTVSHLRFTPELRYTRWTRFLDQQGSQGFELNSRDNAVGFLVGISWHP